MSYRKRCSDCGIFVSNPRRHKERGRCAVQHIRQDVRKSMKLLGIKLRGDFIKDSDERKRIIAELIIKKRLNILGRMESNDNKQVQT